MGGDFFKPEQNDSNATSSAITNAGMESKPKSSRRSRGNGHSEKVDESNSRENVARQQETSENNQLALYRPPSNSALESWPNAWDDDGGPQIFSSRRPRDLGAGLSSGLKNVAKGVGLGAAALIAAPAYGASQEGVGGFFKGLGAGVVMAVALPVTGVGYGIAQVARGAYNTPEALRKSHAGKKWDKKNREWKENWYSLESEEEEVKNLAVVFEEQKKELAAAAAGHTRAEPSNHGDVVDTEYYDLLGVDPTANPAEIRKAYYRLALDCHPDKNPDDPTAHQKFQALGQAYQVLGDEKRRSDYDLHGKDAVQEMPTIDASLFFTMLFGSEALEPFVGKFQMAMFMETFENPETPGKLTQQIMEFEQRKREVKLAVKLRDRLQAYVEGNEQQRKEWREAMMRKARELCKNSFGDALVEAIGWMYENYASQFLGKLDTFLGLGGRVAKIQARHREMGNVWKIAGSAVKASIAANKLAKAEGKKEKAIKQREMQKKEGSQAKKEGSQAKKEGFQAKKDNSLSPQNGSPSPQNDVQSPQNKTFFSKTEKSSFASPARSKSSTSATGTPSRTAGESTEEQQAEQEEAYPTATEEEQRANLEGAKQLEEAMPLILETMLNVCLMDIESTIRKVAKKVLKDLATPIEIRRQRAEALIDLGKIFQNEAEQFKKDHKDEKIDFMRHMENAFVRAAKEADRETHKDEERSSPKSR